MKTKLLKKVRKRFSIVRYDELPSNPDIIFRYYKKLYGLPFYVIFNGDDDVTCRNNYIDAVDALIEIVVNNYSEQFRHSNGKTKKVWWTNK